MSKLIETLEQRTLLSATVLQAETVAQAVTALGKEANQARIDVAASAKLAAADVKAVKSDLHRLRSVPANAALLKEFSNQEKAAASQFKKDAAAAATSISKGTRRSVADAIKFILNPGNAKATAALSADLLALQKLTTSGPVQKLIADVKADEVVATNDLNSITADNAGDAKTVADVKQAKTDLANSSATLSADASGLEGDLTTLITAVQAVQSA